MLEISTWSKLFIIPKYPYCVGGPSDETSRLQSGFFPYKQGCFEQVI